MESGITHPALAPARKRAPASCHSDCASPQTIKGAAVDLSKGFANRISVSNVQLGSNFFNGFNVVPSGTL